MKRALATLVLVVALVACDAPSCPEGQQYDLGPPVLMPIYNGKTTTLIVTYPMAGCR